MSLDHYNKIKVVGKGSYGEVWLVTLRKDKKQYVLKKMEIQNASRREKKAAEQEAKLLSKLRHPNIVSYKDSFESDDGHLYIVMGFCDGGDLYNKLKEQKGTALEEKQVVEWFVQIAMALQYMHERNILHRDLKTQNIFLTKSKIIKVGDLGIARVLEGSNDMATTLIGTPYYMSPELFSNRPYNHKSDVWALGCCVYEMATLKHAFNARDMNSLVYKILRGKMPAMPQQYSNDLIELIKVMLQQTPEKRPSVSRILRNPYIKKHIAIFLEGTRQRRPSSTSSESARRRASRADVIEEVKGSGSNSRPSSAGGDGKKSSKVSSKRKVASSVSSERSSVSSAKHDGRPGSGGRPSSGGKEKRSKPHGAEKPVTPRKARPLPTPPSQSSSSTPRKSASAARKSTKSAARVSSSSSVSSSKDDDTPRVDEEGRRSVNRSARARRRAEQLRESQEQGTPTGPTVRRVSEPVPYHKPMRDSSDSGLGTDSVDGHGKRPVERSVSEPGAANKVPSKQEDEEEENSSDEEEEDDEEIPERAKRREEKEMDEFSSLLETTLKLDKRPKGEGRESPEDDSPETSSGKDSPETGMIAPPPSEMSFAADPMNQTRDIIIAPAAPRAPKGLGNATMTTSGRLMDRIAMLRKDIIQGVGIDVLQQAYEILENEDEGDTEQPLLELMGRPKFELYGAKIWQLKFCEETVFG